MVATRSFYAFEICRETVSGLGGETEDGTLPLSEVCELEGAARHHPDAVGCVALSCRGRGMPSASSNGVLAARNWRRFGGFREWIWRYSTLLYLVTVRDELRG